MKTYLLLFLFLIGMLSSCSSGVRGGDPTGVTPTNPIQQVATDLSSLNLLSKKLVGLSRTTGRLSVIETTTKSESSHLDLPLDYLYSFPLPELDGVAAISQKELTVVSQNVAKAFDIPQGSFLDLSEEKPYLSFTLPNEEGVQLRFITSLGAGSWLSSTYEYSFDGFENQPSSVSKYVGFLSKDGLDFYLIHYETGSYAVFSRPSAGEPFNVEEPTLACPQTNVRFENISLVRFFADQELFVLGNNAGDLYFAELKKTEDCLTVDEWRKQTVKEGSSPIGFAKMSTDQYFVSDDTGDIYTFNLSSENFEKITNIKCNIPNVLTPLDDRHLAVICQDSEGEWFNSNSLIFSVLDIDQSTETYRDNYTTKKVAGVGFDPDVKEIYILSHSGIGILDTLQYETGTSERKIGLFIDDIFENL